MDLVSMKAYVNIALYRKRQHVLTCCLNEPVKKTVACSLIRRLK